jgi:hypothetical protein
MLIQLGEVRGKRRFAVHHCVNSSILQASLRDAANHFRTYRGLKSTAKVRRRYATKKAHAPRENLGNDKP